MTKVNYHQSWNLVITLTRCMGNDCIYLCEFIHCLSLCLLNDYLWGLVLYIHKKCWHHGFFSVLMESWTVLKQQKQIPLSKNKIFSTKFSISISGKLLNKCNHWLICVYHVKALTGKHVGPKSEKKPFTDTSKLARFFIVLLLNLCVTFYYNFRICSNKTCFI